MYANARGQRILIWTTIVSIVLFGIAFSGLMHLFPPPPPTADAAEVLRIYSAHNTEFRVGVVVCLLTGTGTLLPLSVAISVQMMRLEQGIPLWSITQALTGALGTIFLWGPPLIWGAAAFTVTRDPSLTLLLHELGWLSFITPVTAFPLQLVSIAFVSLTRNPPPGRPAFPRWIGYLTVWQALQSFGGLVAMLFKSGPLAWDGLIPFYFPLTLFFIWVVAISYTLLRAISDQERSRARPLGGEVT